MKIITLLVVTALLMGACGTKTLTKPVRMELVRVPAGEFLMGSDPAKDLQARVDEKPQHRVALAEFYIGMYEVTNAQYAVFVKSTGHTGPDDWQNGNVPAGKENHPVVNISWNDGVAFTKWLEEESGLAFRLCSEAEWEKACRGARGFIYPWGDTLDASKANTYEAGVGTTTTVGAYSSEGDSPYGVADIAGNVEEWVTVGDASDYYQTSPVQNAQGLATFTYQVARGGSFYLNGIAARCAHRLNFSSDTYFTDIGLRVCVSPGL